MTIDPLTHSHAADADGANLDSPEFEAGEVPEGSVLIFGDTRVFLKHSI